MSYHRHYYGPANWNENADSSGKWCWLRRRILSPAALAVCHKFVACAMRTICIDSCARRTLRMKANFRLTTLERAYAYCSPD